MHVLGLSLSVRHISQDLHLATDAGNVNPPRANKCARVNKQVGGDCI